MRLQVSPVVASMIRTSRGRGRCRRGIVRGSAGMADDDQHWTESPSPVAAKAFAKAL